MTNPAETNRSTRGRLKLATLLPLVVGLGVATLAVLGWQLLESREEQAIRDRITLVSEIVQDQVLQGVNDRGLSLLRMAKRWEYRGGLDQPEWATDARMHTEQYPGYQAIEWIDPSLHARWIEPLVGNERALNADLGFETNRRRTFERSRDRHEIVITPPVFLLQGGVGLLIAAPIYQKNQSAGFILGVFRVQELLNAVLKNTATGFAISIRNHGKEIYYRGAATRLHERNWSHANVINCYGENFEIRVWPTAAEFNQLGNQVDDGVLAIGLALALFLGVTTRLTQSAQTQAKILTATNRALQLESARRQEREVQLTAVLQSTDDGILVVNPTGEILTANSQFVKLWNLPEESLQTRTEDQLLEFITSQLLDPEKVQRAVQQLRQTDAAAFATLSFKEGRVFNLYTNVVKCRGERIGRLWSVRDITARQQMETAIRQAQRQTELLLHSVGEGIYGLDAAGNTTFVNPVAAQLLGYTSAELIGKPQHQLIHHHRSDGTEYPKLECPIYAAFTDGQVHRVDHELFWRKDGSSFPVEYTSTPVRDETGQLTGAVVVFRDSTDRKQGEENLRASAAHTRHLNEVLQSISEINQLISQKKNWQDLLNAACQVLLKTRGYTSAWVGVPDSGPQKSITVVGHAGLPEDFLQHFTSTWDDCPTGQGAAGSAIRGRLPIVIEDTMTDPRLAPWRDRLAQIQAASIASFPILHQGRIFGVLTVNAAQPNAFDADEIKILQDLATQLAQRLQSINDEQFLQESAATLEKSLHEKEALLREVHHRVKNNLQIVTSLLNLQVRRTESPALVTALRDTQNRIRSMALLHEHLYQSADLTEANFALYVKNLCAHLLRAYGTDGGRIQLVTQVTDMILDLEAAIPCGLLITELVSNALKHAFPGSRTGTIVVATYYNEEGWLVLRVADDGIGFTPKLVPDPSPSLGMQLIHSLTEQLGGVLEQEPPPGTTFRVTVHKRLRPALQSP